MIYAKVRCLTNICKILLIVKSIIRQEEPNDSSCLKYVNVDYSVPALAF